MAEVVRKAVGRLKKFLDKQDKILGVLPLVHVTRAYSFADILENGELEPQQCEVLGEPLTYMFYGRPAYRAREGNNARLEFEWPIILIFDPDKMLPIKRVFPFDTGAFSLGLYGPFFDKQSQLEDFELPPRLESAQRVVSALYRDNEEYYIGLSRKNVDISLGEFEAQGLQEMSRLPGVQDTDRNGKRDERSSAIEFQFDRSIPLKGTLLAIVLPQPYLGIPAIQDRLTEWDVPEILTYETLHNLGGEAWVGQIYKIVRDFYQKIGCL